MLSVLRRGAQGGAAAARSAVARPAHVAVRPARSLASALSRRALSARALDASRLEITHTAMSKEHIPKEELAFGTSFSDHMLECDWSEEEGWADPVIRPYGDLAIDPAASVLHYALECFEGMKAYMDDQGRPRLFRPEMNMARMNHSLRRLHMANFDEAEFLKLIKEAVWLDQNWIPRGDGYSLYLRPTAISTHRFLGVGPSKSMKLYMIMSPVGPYYPEGFKSVSLLADSKNTRAWPGGTGDTKIGGNYAPTIGPQMDAAKKGYTQVLWLFGPHHEVTEVGTMNLFVHWKNDDGIEELITAPLDGTILPGVTRDSIIHLAREEGITVSERLFTMDDLAKACEEGRVYEAFGSGTAAIVSPINNVAFEGVDYAIPVDPELDAGPLTHRMFKKLTDIQYGRVEGPPGWSVILEEP
mmetsp:Transcript_171408/g.416809  ORF Transcript_171408/g.416809 Transcript_171408/m.416809 type:complete len:414 (+) Transcript_171408:59-1300(+)